MAPGKDKGDVNLVAGPVSTTARLCWDDRRSSISGPHRVALPLKRDASKLAFTLDHVLSAEECECLIQAAESVGFSQAGLGRPGAQIVDTKFRDSSRLITEDFALAHLIYRRVVPHLPSIWQGRRLIGLNEQLKFLRYQPGQKFVPHYDGCFMRPNTSNKTCLTLQLYLSAEHVEGGATIFCDNDGKAGTRCEPLPGKALIFQHNILHEGEEVRNGTKYTIRTDVEYSGWSLIAALQEFLGFGGCWSEQRWRCILMLVVVLPFLLSILRSTAAV